MQKNPLVTICLLAYNSEKTISQTLSSLLRQTYRNIQIIISDNGSSDKTLETISSLIKDCDRDRLIIRKNIPDIKPGKFYDGCYDNCNGCLKSGLIKGEYVTFFHSDDIYEKDIIKKEVEFLQKNRQTATVFSSGFIINFKGQITEKYKLPKELKNKDVYNFSEIFKSLLKYGNKFLITPSFMARTKIFDENEIGLFRTEGDVGGSADLEMWIRILEKHPIGILREKLIRRRSGDPKKKQKIRSHKKSGFFMVMDKHLEKHPMPFEKPRNFLEYYEYQRDSDNALRALAFFQEGHLYEAKNLVKNPFKFKNFIILWETINFLRIKIILLRIALFIYLNVFKKLPKNLS